MNTTTTQQEKIETLIHALEWLRDSSQSYLHARDEVERHLAQHALTHALARAGESIEFYKNDV